MQLRFKGLRPFVVMIKNPEFFIRSFGCQETVEVSDQLGFAILASYPNDFEKIEKIEKRCRKVVEDLEVK